MSKNNNNSTSNLPSGSWMFNDAAFGQRALPRTKSLLNANDLSKLFPNAGSSVDRLFMGRRLPSRSNENARGNNRKRRKIGKNYQKMSATVAGEIDIDNGNNNNMLNNKKDSEEERMYARLGLDPADAELLRRSASTNNISNQRAREQAWEKMQNEKKAKADRAKRKGLLDPNIKFNSEEEKKKKEEEARLKAEAEAKAERQAARRAEERAAKAEVAAQMGMTLEEMEAMEGGAEEETQQIIEEYTEAFKQIDADGSGYLSPDELRDVMDMLGEDMNPEELEEIIKEADKDGDGEIDLEEFINMMRARKRVELLAKSMTKAHVRPSSRQKTPQTDRAMSESGESTAGGENKVEYYTLGEHKFPLSGPSLPPLQIGKALASRRHIRQAGMAGGVVDQYYSRPTPHVLKTGAAATADQLRIQLARAQRLVKTLDKKVEEGIEWVQANCPVTNIRAQQYCQKHGLEKLTQLFNRIAYQKMIAAIRKWNETIEFEKNQEKVDNYMKWKGSRRLIKMVQEWDLKQLMSAYDKWHHTVMGMKKQELDACAIEIQKVARGFLARRRVGRMLKNKAAIQIQRVGRGMLGRKVAAAKRWEKKRHDAACLIQLRWRGYEGRKLGKIIKQKHREYEAACLLQRAWRGYKGRAIAKVIAMKKLENDMAIRIQRLWRTRAARQLVFSMRAAIAEEEAALYIQTWWRGILGAREGRARIMARRRVILREESAMKIQGAWRIFLARKKVEHKRLEMAVLRVQCAWRARSGRMAYHLKKQAKKQIEK